MPFLSLMTLTFDLWPWPSNATEWGTKHVFCVNLAQIRSAVPEIFHTQTKNHGLTAPKTEPSAVQCRLLRAGIRGRVAGACCILSSLKVMGSSAVAHVILHCESKKGATLTMATTLSILGRFAEFFHWRKEQQISNKNRY